MKSSRISVIGLVASGKSTFLAALYYSLKHPAAAGGLRLSNLPSDQGYVRSLTDRWLQFEDVGRTETSAEESVELQLEADGGIHAVLAYPDLWGEEFKEQWTHRSCSSNVAECIEASHSVLFFIGPAIKRPRRIFEVNSDPVVSAPPDEPARSFTMDDACDEVVMIELIQFARSLGRGSLKIAIICSAWDEVKLAMATVGRGSATPSDWISEQLPMLAQVLASNVGNIEAAIYGVSAIGGSLQRDRETLIKTTSPLDRILVVESDGNEHHDIRSPLDWLLKRRQ